MFGSRLASLVRNVTLLSLFASGCSDGADPLALPNTDSASVSASITGGTLAAEGEFPAVVALGGCSGTLVHPSLVVYAEHCGTAIAEVRFGPSSDAPTRVVNTDRCRSIPGAKLGDGSDLAYCVLAEPVLDIEPERILAGCELADFDVGKPAIMVGYGVDHDGGTYGQQRVATSRIDSIGDELFLEQGSADTCRGDSGGPVFVEHREPDGSTKRRVVGVTSAGTESECGRGIAHYVNLTRKLDWLESSSQLDVTPCFNQGEWSPTPACRLETCGDALEPPADDQPPSIEWISPVERGGPHPLSSDATFIEFELAIDAFDADGGVEAVTISLSSHDGELLFRRRDEIPPYGLPLLRVPPGRFTLDAEARDFSGNTESAALPLQIGDEPAMVEFTLAGGACAWSAGRSTGASGVALLLVFVIGLRRVRRAYTLPRDELLPRA